MNRLPWRLLFRFRTAAGVLADVVAPDVERLWVAWDGDVVAVVTGRAAAAVPFADAGENPLEHVVPGDAISGAGGGVFEGTEPGTAQRRQFFEHRRMPVPAVRDRFIEAVSVDQPVHPAGERRPLLLGLLAAARSGGSADANRASAESRDRRGS